jgi:hypothetical protein
MIILPSRYASVRFDEEHAQKWCGESFVWTGRDSYLAWVAAWKAELHRRVADIRSWKARRRDRSLSIEERNLANWHRQALRIECANLMLLRSMAKKLSAQQRQQRLAA